MAAIDKTYVNKEQLLEAISWAKEIGEVTLENGYKFRPLDFIGVHNDMENLIDASQYVLWNTPMWFDRWLWLNCPLSFVQIRLQEQYDSYSLESFDVLFEPPTIHTNQKYKFLQTPWGYNWKHFARGKGKKQSLYYISILNAGGEYRYDKQTNTWGECFGILPYNDEYFMPKNKVPSKKALLRLLKKWNLPIGSIVLIKNLHYYGMDFKIRIK
jgi:hypothetical protein